MKKAIGTLLLGLSLWGEDLIWFIEPEVRVTTLKSALANEVGVRTEFGLPSNLFVGAGYYYTVTDVTFTNLTTATTKYLGMNHFGLIIGKEILPSLELNAMLGLANFPTADDYNLLLGAATSGYFTYAGEFGLIYSYRDLSLGLHYRYIDGKPYSDNSFDKATLSSVAVSMGMKFGNTGSDRGSLRSK